MLTIFSGFGSKQPKIFSLVEETFSPMSLGYSRLWQCFVSVHRIAMKLKTNSASGVGVTGNDFHH